MTFLSDVFIWAYYWQTLLGAGIALLGAWLTVRKIREQISESKLQRADEISRRNRAARVTLPLTLSAVAEIIDQAAQNMCDIRERFLPDGAAQSLESIMAEASIPDKFEPIKLPPEVLSSFEKFVETLDNPSEIKHVHELVASLQIVLSRYNSFDLKGAGVATSLERQLLAVARAKLLTDAMFSYAREPNAKDFSLMANSRTAIWDQIHASAQSLVFRRPSPDLYFGGFAEVIDHNKETDRDPWVEGGSL